MQTANSGIFRNHNGILYILYSWGVWFNLVEMSRLYHTFLVPSVLMPVIAVPF